VVGQFKEDIPDRKGQRNVAIGSKLNLAKIGSNLINMAITSVACDTSMQFWFLDDRLSVRPMLSDRCPVCLSCLSCLSVCDVGVLWPNGWTDKDETQHAGRPRPGHIVLDGDPGPSPQRSTATNFQPISVVAKWLHESRCHLVER